MREVRKLISYYGSEISPNKTETVEGFLICRNVPIARTGDQIYMAKELQLDGDPMRSITVHRLEQDVFEPAVMASFEGKPVTDEHPGENVSPENFADYAKGHVQNVRREGDFIVADLHIQDADLIDAIQSGRKTEVSCGYMCNYEQDGADYKQTHIRGNHVAVVERGRAGREVAIKDAAAETAGKGGKRMTKFWKDVLMAFGKAAKDAEPEELEELADAAAETLEQAKAPEDAPAKAQESDPAEAKTEDEEVEEKVEEEVVTKDDKLDQILEMLRRVLEKEEPKEETLDEEDIDEEIERRSETIKADEMEDECGTRDAASVMRVMRPAIAKITNSAEKSAVCDALLKAFSADADVMGNIMGAAKKSAMGNAADSAKPKYEKTCEDQESAYASRNPHKKKED